MVVMVLMVVMMIVVDTDDGDVFGKPGKPGGGPLAMDGAPSQTHIVMCKDAGG